MSKTKLTIIIVIILSVGLGVVSGIYFYTKQSSAPIIPTTPSNKTIFGGIGGVRTDLPKDETNSTQNQETDTIDKPTSTSTPKTPPLRLIASGPISGADFVTRDVVATGTPIIVSTSTKVLKTKISKPKVLKQEEKIRYIERGTGHIYEASSSTIPTERITNSTQTRINETFFDKKGENILMRGLLGNSDNIQTRLGTTIFETPTSTSMSLKTKDLPYNMISVVLSPEKDYFAYYTEQKNVGSFINISRLDGTGVFSVYKSPFREWLLSWPNKDTLVLNTKPSKYSEGFAYSINIKSKAFKRITGGQKGLTTLVSPDGLNVLVGESTEGSMKLSVLNLKTQASKDIYIRTLPEKCVWSTLEKNTLFCAASESIVYAPYPDAWYQGLVFFDDNIWKINTETQENKLVYVIKDFIKEGIDATNIILNKNEDYLMFTNKKDLSLWGLQIEKPQKEIPVSITKSSSKTSTSTKATSTKNTK